MSVICHLAVEIGRLQVGYFYVYVVGKVRLFWKRSMLVGNEIVIK